MNIPILGFVLAMGLQLALFAYTYGRLTMRIEVLEKDAGKPERGDEKIVKMVEAGDDKITKMVERLLQQMEHSFAWYGETLGNIGTTLDEHGQRIRKIEKMTGVSNDHLPAQRDSEGTGRHPAAVRIPAVRVGTNPGRPPPLPRTDKP